MKKIARSLTNFVLLGMLLVLAIFHAQPAHAQGNTGKWGFIRLDGSEAIPPIFDQASPLSEGLAMVRIGQRWGFVDATGKQVIPVVYAEAYPFKHGVTSARRRGESGWILINKKGERLGTKTFSSPLFFSDGLAAFREDSKTGYVDLDGKVVIEPGPFSGGSFDSGLAAITLRQGYAFIDKTGKIVLPGPYEQTDGFRSGYARVKVKNREALIDTRGKYFLPPKYYAVSFFTEGLVGVKTSSKAAGFLNEKGKMFIAPKWHFALPFAHGFSIVITNDKYGVINRAGKVVIPVQYETIQQRGPKIFRAVKDGKTVFLNADGKPFSREEVTFLSIVSEGLVGYKNNAGKYGFLKESDGTIAIQPLYCEGSLFSGSLAPVRTCE